MIVRLAVMAVAASVFVVFVWFRARHLKIARKKLSDQPDRGLFGEIRTAFGDLARQFMSGDRDMQRRRDRKAELDRWH